MYSEGAVSKLKINFINDLLGQNFQGVCRSMGSLFKVTIKKISSQEGLKLRDLVEHKKKMRGEIKGQKEPI